MNAGVALVSSLEEMDVEDFRRVERVNVEGTFLMLAARGSILGSRERVGM